MLAFLLSVFCVALPAQDFRSIAFLVPMSHPSGSLFEFYRIFWYLDRLSPRLMEKLGERMMPRLRQELRDAQLPSE